MPNSFEQLNEEETRSMARSCFGEDAHPTPRLRMITEPLKGAARIQQLWTGLLGRGWIDMPMEEVAKMPPRGLPLPVTD